MKINFSKLKFRPSLFEPETEIKDFHKQLANALWQNKDIAVGKFALKLFDNPEIEINDAEKGYIKEALEQFLQWVRVPVLEALSDEKAE